LSFYGIEVLNIAKSSPKVVIRLKTAQGTQQVEVSENPVIFGEAKGVQLYHYGNIDYFVLAGAYVTTNAPAETLPCREAGGWRVCEADEPVQTRGVQMRPADASTAGLESPASGLTTGATQQQGNSHAGEYLYEELAMKKMLDAAGAKRINITLTAENGRSVKVAIPDVTDNSWEYMQAICRYYAAKIYAQAISLGNGPTGFIYVEAAGRDNDAHLKRIESTLIAVIQQYFDEVGIRLFGKANAGNRVEVKSMPANFTAKVSFGLDQLMQRVYRDKTVVKRDGPAVAIGLDTGGQGTKVCVLKDGIDVTDELFPRQDDSEEARQFDRSKRYRAAFAPARLKKGGSGKEFKDRLVAYAREVKEIVEGRYGVGSIAGVFENLPGAPDYEHDRMASVGELSRGFGIRFVLFGITWFNISTMRRNLAEINKFIPELREVFSGAVFGYGNDMTGWALSLAEEANFKDGVAIITGSGIGVKHVEAGKDTSGANEGGHFCFNLIDMIPSRSQDSPKGSFEDWAGSVRGILAMAEELGLTRELKALGLADITPEHVGLAASGINPATKNSWQGDEVERLKGLALKVWDRIEQREAQHVILLYKLTGKTSFAFGGGTNSGKTGEIRAALLQKYVDA
jgi:hypothetical protein